MCDANCGSCLFADLALHTEVCAKAPLSQTNARHTDRLSLPCRSYRTHRGLHINKAHMSSCRLWKRSVILTTPVSERPLLPARVTANKFTNSNIFFTHPKFSVCPQRSGREQSEASDRSVSLNTIPQTARVRSPCWSAVHTLALAMHVLTDVRGATGEQSIDENT